MARPKRSQEEKELYVSMKGLKAEGWTDKLIQKFLGEPDKTARNPMFASAAPVKLYNRTRVLSVSQTKEFLEEKQKADVRKESARKAVLTKKDALMSKIEQLEIQVKTLPPEKVKSLAIDAYNDHKAYISMEYGHDCEFASKKNNDKNFLDRIVVNFIRHELTSYDHSLEIIAGKVGASLALAEIRRKVYAAIAQAYPVYAEECKRQLERRRILVVD
jgi:hypothetical protein